MQEKLWILFITEKLGRIRAWTLSIIIIIITKRFCFIPSPLNKQNKPQTKGNLEFLLQKHKRNYQKNNKEKWDFFILLESSFTESAKILTTNLTRKMVKTIKFHVFTHNRSYSFTILNFTSNQSIFLRDLTWISMCSLSKYAFK